MCKSGSCLLQGVNTHLLLGNRSLRSLVKFLDGLLVVSEILLTSDKDDGKTLTEMQDLGDPLIKTIHVSMHWAREVAVQKRRRTFSWTLSRESGESTAKQIRMTCESG